MSRQKKIILVVLIITASLFGIYKFINWFAPGSYPQAEEYELDASEAELINVIKQYKVDYPELSVPNVQIRNEGQHVLDDGKDSSSHWYNFYFYYKKENQIVFTWTRPISNNKTTFAFVSINNGLNLGNWKDINEDFSSAEDKTNKEKFKARILDSIIERLKVNKINGPY